MEPSINPSVALERLGKTFSSMQKQRLWKKPLSSIPWIVHSFHRYLLSTYCVPYSKVHDKTVNNVNKLPILMELSFAFPSSFFKPNFDLQKDKFSIIQLSELSSIKKQGHGRRSEYLPKYQLRKPHFPGAPD